jgi:pilus assembly protein Flp/PilA
MQFELWKIRTRILGLVENEDGQDLIEYALVVALIAFAATAGMGSLANAINTAFTNVGTRLTTAIT